MKKQFVFLFSALFWNCAYSSCRTPLGVTSECVSLNDCPSLLSAFNQRPLPDHVISYLRKSQCGFDGYTPTVCCGPLPAQAEITQPPVTRRPSTSLVPSNEVDPVYEEDSKLAPNGQCGIETNGDRIYGGQIADLDEFPWMALLGYTTRAGALTYQCGGVLINKRYVLTAAHCLTGKILTKVGKLTSVRLGEYNTQTPIDCLDGVCADPPQEIPVLGAYPNAGYRDAAVSRHHDIGLIRLAKRAVYSYYVQPCCLYSGAQRLSTNDNVYVAGWGKTLEGKNSPIKLKLALPIADKDVCVSKYETLGASISDRQICAGGAFSQDACSGDSGGPLMSKRPDGVWEAIGVVSFGYGCGRENWPGIYTLIDGYSDWIKSVLRSTNV